MLSKTLVVMQFAGVGEPPSVVSLSGGPCHVLPDENRQITVTAKHVSDLVNTGWVHVIPAEEKQQLITGLATGEPSCSSE
jgi:hypothetical protein